MIQSETVNNLLKYEFQQQWAKLFYDLKSRGKICSPRDMKIIELENYMFELHPRNMLCSFEARKLSTKYLVGELAWYFSADRDDRRIEHYSKFWTTLRNDNSPYYNSNYGYYIFEENQVDHVISMLTKDKDTRQACIMINRKEVSMSQSKDKLCTYSISFRIRENKLNMSVNMRSNDIVLGATVDVFQFLVIYDYILKILRYSIYPDLQIGIYSHKADSFHIYERHFDMMESIVSGSKWIDIECPELYDGMESIMLQQFLPHYEEEIRLGKTNPMLPKIKLENKFTQWCVDQLKNS